MNPVLLILAILPGLVISYVMFRLDKYEREPFGALVFCFVLGAAMTMPAVWAERWAFHREGLQSDYSIGQVLWLSFGAVALNEEVLKFGAMRLLIFPRRFFNEPIDGIVYAVLIAMGFAIVYRATGMVNFAQGEVMMLIASAAEALKGDVSNKDKVRAELKKADFKSLRGGFKYNTNQFPIQNFYIQEAVKDADGMMTVKTIATAVKDGKVNFTARALKGASDDAGGTSGKD